MEHNVIKGSYYKIMSLIGFDKSNLFQPVKSERKPVNTRRLQTFKNYLTAIVSMWFPASVAPEITMGINFIADYYLLLSFRYRGAKLG